MDHALAPDRTRVPLPHCLRLVQPRGPACLATTPSSPAGNPLHDHDFNHRGHLDSRTMSTILVAKVSQTLELPSLHALSVSWLATSTDGSVGPSPRFFCHNANPLPRSGLGPHADPKRPGPSPTTTSPPSPPSPDRAPLLARGGRMAPGSDFSRPPPRMLLFTITALVLLGIERFLYGWIYQFPNSFKKATWVVATCWRQVIVDFRIGGGGMPQCGSLVVGRGWGNWGNSWGPASGPGNHQRAAKPDPNFGELRSSQDIQSSLLHRVQCSVRGDTLTAMSSRPSKYEQTGNT